MKYFRNVYILLFILIALSLIVFFYTSENTVKINKNCPIGEVESDYTRHYKEFITPNSEFVAYKQFSTYRYQFVSLVKNNNRYFLSVSGSQFNQFPVLTKEISRKAGEDIFKHRLNTNKQMLMTDDALHPACVFVGDKGSQGLRIEGLFLGEIGLYPNPQKVDSEMEKIYSSLRILVNEEFKLEIEKVKADGMTMSKSVSDISELIGTKDEMKAFIGRLRKNPFFELMPD